MIPWPMTLPGSPLSFDLLIATATNPTIINEQYLPVKQIADAWKTNLEKRIVTISITTRNTISEHFRTRGLHNY